MGVDVDVSTFPCDSAALSAPSGLIIASPPRPLAVVSPISVCEASVISVVSPVPSAIGSAGVPGTMPGPYGMMSPVLTSTPISRTPPCDISSDSLEPCAKKARRGSASSNDDTHNTSKILHHSSTSSTSTAPYSTSTTPQPNSSDLDQKQNMPRMNLEKTFDDSSNAVVAGDHHTSRTGDTKSASQLDHLNHMVDKQFADQDRENKPPIMSPEQQIPPLVDRHRYLAMRCSRTAGIDIVILRRKVASRRAAHPAPASTHSRTPHSQQHQQHSTHQSFSSKVGSINCYHVQCVRDTCHGYVNSGYIVGMCEDNYSGT